jgi:hypothetical protein
MRTHTVAYEPKNHVKFGSHPSEPKEFLVRMSDTTTNHTDNDVMLCETLFNILITSEISVSLVIKALLVV